MTLSEYIGEDESRWKVQSNLSRLGMEEYETKLEQLSGGQREKAAWQRCWLRNLTCCFWTSPPIIWISR